MIHDVLNKKNAGCPDSEDFFWCFHSCLSQFLPKPSGFVVCGEHVQGGKNQLPTICISYLFIYIYIFFFLGTSIKATARNTKYQIPTSKKKHKKSIEMVGFQFKDLQILTYFFFWGGHITTGNLTFGQVPAVQTPKNASEFQFRGGVGRFNGGESEFLHGWDGWDGWMDGTLMKNHVLQNIVIRIID